MGKGNVVCHNEDLCLLVLTAIATIPFWRNCSRALPPLDSCSIREWKLRDVSVADF